MSRCEPRDITRCSRTSSRRKKGKCSCWHWCTLLCHFWFVFCSKLVCWTLTLHHRKWERFASRKTKSHHLPPCYKLHGLPVPTQALISLLDILSGCFRCSRDSWDHLGRSTATKEAICLSGRSVNGRGRDCGGEQYDVVHLVSPRKRRTVWFDASIRFYKSY